MNEWMRGSLQIQREKTDALIEILNLHMSEFDAVYEGTMARNLRRSLMQRLEYVEDMIAMNEKKKQ